MRIKTFDERRCSGFLIKCVYGTNVYRVYVSQRYMAISIHEHSRESKSTKSTHGVSTYIPHSGIHIESGLIR